ncbi:Uncharacterised protein [Legionella steigerwaltii]|uniref:Transmembrane protein n=1 Tax=Legionella steigerwaltii TaxID=460 RepID=A0A378LFR9_9GAMM|nr:hypothetical protein [Legionella steigerwaltii]KTD77621.1 hypothetical protein Lstg_1978 [Legionella steigerwaltii]STY22931.1 Uncharacterised protein [Legionella steigerwaltii]
MTVAQKLDKASGIFFFAGFLLSKLQYIPHPLASAIFRFVSLGIYLFAYLSWLTACLLHPDHKELYRKWYGFAQIKEQFFLASLIGFGATILSVAAVFIPALFPPAAWLFLIGNILWAIGEHHKLKNPPQDDPSFSYPKQQAYLFYARTSCVISLVTAIAATFIFVFPPAAIPITIFSLVICAGLGALAFEFWLNSTFGDHKPTLVPGSYAQMGDTLGPSNALDHADTPEPGCWSSLFNRQSDKPTKLSLKSTKLLDAEKLEENLGEHSFTTNSLL